MRPHALSAQNSKNTPAITIHQATTKDSHSCPKALNVAYQRMIVENSMVKILLIYYQLLLARMMPAFTKSNCKALVKKSKASDSLGTRTKTIRFLLQVNLNMEVERSAVSTSWDAFKVSMVFMTKMVTSLNQDSMFNTTPFRDVVCLCQQVRIYTLMCASAKGKSQWDYLYQMED